VPEFARLVGDAADTIFGANYPTDRDIRQEVLGKASDEHRRSELEPIDDRFLQASRAGWDRFVGQFADFVRGSPELFFRERADLPEKFSWMSGKGL
jgi:hypothetical protein